MDKPATPSTDGADSRQNAAGPKKGTLAWLARETQKAFPQAMESLVNALRKGASRRGDLDPYYVVTPSDAQKASRTDLDESDDSIQYADFSPAPVWGPGYTVLLVRVAPRQQEFMFHSGEEALLPISGSVAYELLHGDEQGIRRTPLTVATGKAVRINPQTPHSATGIPEPGSTHAVAWMVLRYLNGAARKIIDTRTGLYSSEHRHPKPRTVTEEQLADPAVYAGIQWGLSEAITTFRQSADLTISTLGKECGVDPAVVSRIESLQGEPGTKGVNVSADAVLRLAAYLSIPLPMMIRQALLPKQHVESPLDQLDGHKKSARVRPILGGDFFAHELHFAELVFPAGEKFPVPKECSFPVGTLASWIVKEGVITIDLEVCDPFQIPTRPPIPGTISLTQGSVLHFRNASPRVVEAHTNAQIIQVVRSSSCSCD